MGGEVSPGSLQFFRCLEKGHVRAKCTADVDLNDLCYRCGQSGHKAALCTAAFNCSLYSAAERPAEHRVGVGPVGRLPARPRLKTKRKR
ncbi:unnamed protein product [Parnassius apollo]|uniref:(apollo) hypothetical protein n=1 Tax=Parnassius apollo TaxID=110799 RepID=A0A8S3XH76_PARAO|nr:unnamed protein product [Parnassius apollo]